MNPEAPQPSLLATFLPLALFSMVLAAFIVWLAPRKGQSRFLAVAAIIPCVAPFVVLCLLALTDKKVRDEIEELKRRLASRPPPL